MTKITAQAAAQNFASLARLLIATAVRELQALGQVHVGMCSAWEFCEL